MAEIQKPNEPKKTSRQPEVKCPVMRDVILKSNLTRPQFAEKFGLSIDLVNKMASGDRGLSTANAIKIAKAYGYTLDYLYGLDGGAPDEADDIMVTIWQQFKVRFNYDALEKNPDELQMYVGKDAILLEIDDALLEFMKDMDNAERTFKQSNGTMPKEVYNTWVANIRDKYNALLDSGETGKVHQYVANSWPELKYRALRNTPTPPSGHGED